MLLQAVKFVYAAHIRKVHDEMVGFLGGLLRAWVIQRNGGRWGQCIVGFAQPVRVRDDFSAHCRVQSGREIEHLFQLRAHLQVWNVADRVENRERGAGVVDGLMREEAGKVVVVLTQHGLWLGWNPLEEEYECMERLVLRECGGVERVKVVYDEWRAEAFQELAVGR